jgi:hypothetical protein
MLDAGTDFAVPRHVAEDPLQLSNPV